MHRDKTFLLVHLDQDGEYMLIDQTQIESIRLSGLTEAIIQQHPVLVLTVKTEGTARILIRYISHGMVWSPAYKVDTTNPSTLKLLQQAVVKNEMCDLENTDIELISGFPNFEFRSVVSLFSTITTEDFFNNLGHRKGGNLDRDQCTMTTYSSADDYAGTDIGEATSKSVDLYICGIGKYNLKLNDAILEKLAEGESLYRRVVEWLVLDTREPDGQFAPQILYKQQARAYEEGAWDSLIFSNPFDHPMTAAPVEIVENDRFRGQSLTYWVNPGEEVLLRVTKALSIKTRSIEQEEPDTRNTLEWGGYKFQETKVKGQLFLANRRKEGADILIRRRFTGELDYADEKPEMKILDEGTVSINPRNELRWSVHLAGGAEINLNYSYIVMVKIEH